MEQDDLIRSDTSLIYSQHNVINCLKNKIEYLEKENKMIKTGLSNPEMSLKPINKNIKKILSLHSIIRMIKHLR